MKRFSFGPFREWFGYTRRERRSSFILVMLIAATAGIRFIVPNRNMKIEINTVENYSLTTDSDSAETQTDQEKKSSGPGTERRKAIIDLNRCDSSALEALPGIGPVLSARIIKYRNLLGGYTDVSQLKEVYGLPEETYELVAKFLKADPGNVRKININTADYRQLIRMPYFDRYEVTSILRYRELQGRISGWEELLENKILLAEKIEKVKLYLEFGE